MKLKSKLVLGGVLLFVTTLATIYVVGPQFGIKIPATKKDARAVYQWLSAYQDDHYWQVVAGFCTVYLVLQTFAIPGPIVLSIISGALFGQVIGLTMVSLCATTGASLCYLLSRHLLGDTVRDLIDWLGLAPALDVFRSGVKKNRKNLLSFMMASRVTPIPNILINLASPIVGIPLSTFALGTLFGLIPLNIVHMQSGLLLKDAIDAEQGGLTYKQLAMLALFLGLALLPTLPPVRRRIERFTGTGEEATRGETSPSGGNATKHAVHRETRKAAANGHGGSRTPRRRRHVRQ